MLKSLLIENYALIEKLDISFGKGLSIITGETGAGKSILLGALGLILGQRADTKVLKNKDRKCIIEGCFEPNDQRLKPLFDENELDYDALLIFRREINPQGKSRAFINDTPVTLNVLKDIAGKLIDIHSQHENLLIAHSTFRYHVLDGYAGIMLKVADYQAKYSAYNEQKKQLEALREKEKQALAELDYCKFQYDELHKANLMPQEWEELQEELDVLQNAGTIKFALEKCGYLLKDNADNVLSLLNEALNELKNVQNYHSNYAELSSRLQSSEIEIKDIADEIASLSTEVEDDPRRSMQLQDRFDVIQKLILKHNAENLEELITIRDTFYDRIESSESLGNDLEELTASILKTEKALLADAEKISEKRKKAIPALEKEINSLLLELGMPNGKFSIEIQASSHLLVNGTDKLNFLFNANAGGRMQDIAAVASGGELSRLMLAMKSVISIKNFLPTIIFDEIDTGVSGEIGFKIGNILSKIAQNMQVISITHLPQVAAKGSQHFVVYKSTSNNETQTHIKSLPPKERLQEIAKMLGGENPSQTILDTAAELLNNEIIHKN